jgi:hypothetical protein
MTPEGCAVSFTGPTGIRHAVEVTAESLYEAAVSGLNVMKKDDWIDQSHATVATLEATMPTMTPADDHPNPTNDHLHCLS